MTAFRRYRDIVVVVLLLAVPFFFLRASIRKPSELTPIDQAVLRIAAPLEYVSSALARGVSSLFGEYVYLVDVKEDNSRLSYENARLRSRVRELEHAEAESHRLRRLLGMRDTIADETVSAVVVGKDTTEYFRVAHVTIDTPNPRVRVNMPVIALDGAVGTVERVAGEKVMVQLAVDSGFGVDVVVERTGARGFVRGMGERGRYAVRVEYVYRTDEVEIGDLLVTSGVGCRFPKGIPVARVKKLQKREFGIYQSVEAEPTVDFSRLEEVLIILNDSEDCDTATKARKARAQR
ncbi:MAG TPA: rod shape-determining protein MreC [Polyangiaceae bacterium]|nr:rod shape-determining protein MreC [Polyangiaceae bacterium]